MRMEYQQSLIVSQQQATVKKTREEIKQENLDFLFDYVLNHNISQKMGDKDDSSEDSSDFNIFSELNQETPGLDETQKLLQTLKKQSSINLTKAKETQEYKRRVQMKKENARNLRNKYVPHEREKAMRILLDEFS